MTTLTEQDINYEIAKKDFYSFLQYVHLLEPPPGRGNIRMEMWPHIKEVCQALKDHRLIVWLKSRQIGASWLMAAYDLWTAMFHSGATVLLFSQGEPEAQEKLQKCKYIYERLPRELQEVIGDDNRGLLTFSDRGSAIKALPSTQKAGRSMTGTLVDMDEADFHEYFDANFAAVMPILNDNGGQMVLVSTSNAQITDTLFKRTYLNAPGNKFHAIFYGWAVRPNRTPEWYEERRLEYDDPYQFMKEYPDSAEAALAPPESLMAFDMNRLDTMKEEDVRKPISEYGATRIYRKFRPGGKYAAGTDTGHGVGGDASCTFVLDVRTGSQVATVWSANLSPEQFALESIKLLKLYGNPIWGIEDNDWGILVIRIAKDERYPRIHWRNNKRIGWRTDKATRPLLWGELIESVATASIVIFDAEGLQEFYGVQRDPKSGMIVSPRHDDFCVAAGLAWMMRPFSFQSRQDPDNFIDRQELKQRRQTGSYKWSINA